jgi:hypothetical protein
MKRRKKFDGGGSVMDKPNQDMRDPAYRKKLEREQALESSAPEFAFLGPAGKTQASLKSAKDILTKIPDPKELAYRTINYGLGSGMGRITDDISKKIIQSGLSIKDQEEIRKEKQEKAKQEKAKRESDSEMKRETRGMKKGGKVSSASSRADGCAQRGKTRGKMV